jgi:hypothetical protein
VAISLGLEADGLVEIRKQQGSGDTKMRITRFQTLLLVLSFLAVTAWMVTATVPTAQAATTNARIQGTVSDPQGAVIPNAKVTAINEATGVKYTTVSNSGGAYLFPELPIGSYSIEVTSPGFKSFHASGIVLTIDQEYVEPARLTVGATTEVVQVAASPIQVDTTDMQFSNVVDSSQMVDLPLIGRNFSGLEITLPGVQASSLNENERIGGNSVSGSQQQQSEYLINGADTNDIALNTQMITPILDALSEFNLIDGPMNAEYDRNSGGIVSASIKSGTNAVHGDVFDFYRDTFLNTNNFFQKPGPVSAFHQHIVGGTVGGPILKNKLFIFGAFQATPERIPEGTGGSAYVYTPSQLTGDFSSDAGTFSTNPIPSTIKIPAGCTAGETWADCLGAEGLNGKLPTTSFDSIASALVTKYVPAAPSPTNTNYLFNETENETNYQYDGRVDFNPNSRNQFSFVGVYITLSLTETIPFSGASLPGFGDEDVEHIQQYSFDYVRQFSASAVNDLGLHWTRMNYKSSFPQQTVQPSSVGFSITPQDASAATIPTINVNGYFNLGGTANGPQPRIDQNYQIEDNFSKVFGHHALKFGYDGRRFNVSNTFDAKNSGDYTFSSSAGSYSTGDSSLDFLLGIPATYYQGTGAVIQADAFLNYIYAQDSWQATNDLSINYGLGYSIDTPLLNHQFGGLGVGCYIIGEQSKIFPGAPEGLVYPGDPGCTIGTQATTHYNEFGPRVGFAWSPNLGKISGGPGKFSIRGGFGIYYDRTEEESALQTLGTPPFGMLSSGATDFGGSPAFANPFADINGGLTTPGNTASESNRFPYAEPVAGAPVNFTNPAEPIANEFSSFGPGFRAPYAENFQLSIERELPSKMVARVSYVGSVARHNQNTYEGNPETTAGQAACLANPTCSLTGERNEQALYFPQNKLAGVNTGIIEVGEVGSEASSNYNALQVSVTKGQTHGLGFQLSYTYAHALDTGSSFENTGFANDGERGFNEWQPSLNYGDSTYDARQRLVFSPVYTVPRFKSGGEFSPANILISGWQISGITSLATGFPYDISYAGWGTSRSLYCDAWLSWFACPDAPDQTAPLTRLNPRTRDSVTGGAPWFGAGSFAPETVGTFGTTRRNPYHGPGINNTNAIIAKNFSLGKEGTRSLQIRMESDNVFNHTQFYLPDGNYTDLSTTFGEISTAASGRQTQLAAKITF